ncbi:MAG: hypothetical protein HKO68_19355 [Desulfobacterales bacterium]|nr:hypothetical protein [Desulfobacterales bacterium]
MPEEIFDPVDIMGPQIFGLPVDRQVLLSNHKNVYKKRIEKRQRKLMVRIPFLKSFLRKGEKILLVTTGYSPLASPAQYLTGYLFVYLKRAMYIFTNYRIFHIPTTSVGKYKSSIAQIDYAGCQSIVLKGGTLVVQYSKSGESENFKAIAVSERKKIRTLLKKNIPLSGTKSHLAQRIHLCPRCARKLTAGKYTCGNCHLEFKSKSIATTIAALIPGGGYFYTQHYLIGGLNALLEIILIVYGVFLFNDFFNQVPVNTIHLVLVPLIFFYIKISSVIHSIHFIDEFIPQETKKKPRKTS